MMHARETKNATKRENQADDRVLVVLFFLERIVEFRLHR